TISIMETETANTRNVLISATLQLPTESTFNRNGAILFDYRNPNDFKFASVHGGGRWRIGERTADGWDFLAQGERKLSAETDLFVSVEIRGSMVVLRSGTSVMASYDFGEPFVGGQIGLGSKNGEALFDDVVVDPLTSSEEFEFVELFNTSGSIVDLSGWQLDSGIQWTAAEGTSLGPGEALTVVRFDPDDATRSGQFRRVLGIDESVELVGPYAGKLADSGETVRLLEPLEGGDPERGMTLVDRLAYEDQSPWPVTPDGGGHSLHRTTVDAFGGLVSSFRPLEPSPGSEFFVLAGDLDLNGVVDDDDVAGLVLALNDPAAYEATFGLSTLHGGDLDSDGDVDYDDIEGLVALLATATAAATAPGTPGLDVLAAKDHESGWVRTQHRAARTADDAVRAPGLRSERRSAKQRHGRQDDLADNPRHAHWATLADRALDAESIWQNGE
ncbi:MAG: lamin tail domain-containing protein, partial [Pirellulales bacterium]